MATISQNVNIEMLEKLPDGTFKRKYPKTRADDGTTFDEHLAEKATQNEYGHIRLQDIVHPEDTSKANLASPAFTGTPTAPTATSGTNTTQIATTAFVTGAVSSAGGNVTYLSATPPTSPKTGDTWYQIL